MTPNSGSEFNRVREIVAMDATPFKHWATIRTCVGRARRSARAANRRKTISFLNLDTAREIEPFGFHQPHDGARGATRPTLWRLGGFATPTVTVRRSLATVRAILSTAGPKLGHGGGCLSCAGGVLPTVRVSLLKVRVPLSSGRVFLIVDRARDGGSASGFWNSVFENWNSGKQPE